MNKISYYLFYLTLGFTLDMISDRYIDILFYLIKCSILLSKYEIRYDLFLFFYAIIYYIQPTNQRLYKGNNWMSHVTSHEIKF